MKKTAYPFTYEWNILPDCSISEHEVYLSDMEPDGNKVACGDPVTISVDVWPTTTLVQGKLHCLEEARAAVQKEMVAQLDLMDERIANLKALPPPCEHNWFTLPNGAEECSVCQTNRPAPVDEATAIFRPEVQGK